jgi:hypothetical protein
MPPMTSRTRRPEIARVAATSPTWAYRPIRAGVGPLQERLDSAFG